MNRILERIHHVERPNKVRAPDEPLAIIAVGIGRSGTYSMALALNMLGYKKVYHGYNFIIDVGDLAALSDGARTKLGQDGPTLDAKYFDSIFGDCVAVTDFPAALFAHELAKIYPDAKVILNTREVESWYGSFTRAFDFEFNGPYWYEYFNRYRYWVRQFVETNMRPFFDYDVKNNGRRIYLEHSAAIRRAVPPERLLEWQLGDGWEPLCKFLGKEVPDQPFPKSNEGSVLEEFIQMRVRMAKRDAWTKILYISLVAIAITAVGLRGRIFAA